MAGYGAALFCCCCCCSSSSSCCRCRCRCCFRRCKYAPPVSPPPSPFSAPPSISIMNRVIWISCFSHSIFDLMKGVFRGIIGDPIFGINEHGVNVRVLTRPRFVFWSACPCWGARYYYWLSHALIRFPPTFQSLSPGIPITKRWIIYFLFISK